MRPAVEIALVGAGGLLGAIARYLASGWVTRSGLAAGFPLGTLFVNLVGCFAIGLVAGLAEVRGGMAPELRLLVLVGFLGSLTTYSTFGLETVTLLRGAEVLRAGVSVLAHLVVGFGAVAAGLGIARLAA